MDKLTQQRDDLESSRLTLKLRTMGEAGKNFVHLHVHTHYSLLDGANKVPDLVKRTKALGMDAIASAPHI